jgi:hypothetical protein
MQKLLPIIRRNYILLALAAIILIGIITAVAMRPTTVETTTTSNHTSSGSIKAAQKSDDTKVESGQTQSDEPAASTGEGSSQKTGEQKPATSNDTASAKPSASGLTSGTKTTKPSAPKPPINPTPKPIVNTAAPQILSVNVSLNGGAACGGAIGYNYSLGFKNNTAGGTVTARWELVSGLNYNDYPSFPVLPFGQGTVQISDSLPPYQGFVSHNTSYSVRLHVTSPNSIYSNVITVPACI